MQAALRSPVNDLIEVFLAFAQISLDDYPGMRVIAELRLFHKTPVKPQRQVLYPMAFDIKAYEGAGLHSLAQDRSKRSLDFSMECSKAQALICEYIADGLIDTFTLGERPQSRLPKTPPRGRHLR